MFTWLTVRFIGIASLWLLWHLYGAKAYLKYTKEKESVENDRKN
ncbi:hypothetical protein [Microcystis phage MaeS]|nr:hypothetical protein [Microcystis phage MaeS]